VSWRIPTLLVSLCIYLIMICSLYICSCIEVPRKTGGANVTPQQQVVEARAGREMALSEKGRAETALERARGEEVGAAVVAVAVSQMHLCGMGGGRSDLCVLPAYGITWVIR
jgi:hypothetical protein